MLMERASEVNILHVTSAWAKRLSMGALSMGALNQAGRCHLYNQKIRAKKPRLKRRGFFWTGGLKVPECSKLAFLWDLALYRK